MRTIYAVLALILCLGGALPALADNFATEPQVLRYQDRYTRAAANFESWLEKKSMRSDPPARSTVVLIW